MFQHKFYCVHIAILVLIVPTLYAESTCHTGDKFLDKFWCSNNKCIEPSYVCNGQNECGDNSDERSCQGCHSGTFSCRDGTCIDPLLVCDKTCDCHGCVDEAKCPQTTFTTTPTPEKSGSNLIIMLPAIIIPQIFGVFCVCLPAYVNWRRRIARSRAPSAGDEQTAPSGDNGAPPGNNQWAYSIFAPPQYSAFDNHGQLPYSNVDISPPPYESVKPTHIEDGEAAPPPNYETIA